MRQLSQRQVWMMAGACTCESSLDGIFRSSTCTSRRLHSISHAARRLLYISFGRPKQFVGAVLDHGSCCRRDFLRVESAGQSPNMPGGLTTRAKVNNGLQTASAVLGSPSARTNRHRDGCVSVPESRPVEKLDSEASSGSSTSSVTLLDRQRIGLLGKEMWAYPSIASLLQNLSSGGLQTPTLGKEIRVAVFLPKTIEKWSNSNASNVCE